VLVVRRGHVDLFRRWYAWPHAIVRRADVHVSLVRVDVRRRDGSSSLSAQEEHHGYAEEHCQDTAGNATRDIFDGDVAGTNCKSRGQYRILKPSAFTATDDSSLAARLDVAVAGCVALLGMAAAVLLYTPTLAEVKTSVRL
jgi:hypothetical protein